jgi:hypothetical protein
MRHLRTLLTGIALACAFTLGFAATSASTGYGPIRYCDQVKAPDHWCGTYPDGRYTGIHSWDENNAFDGAASYSVWVCQRLLKPSTGRVVAGSTCASEAVFKYYGDTQCVCYEANVSQTGFFNERVIGKASA